MEFVKGEKVRFNLKPEESTELTFTYGQEYLISDADRLMVVLLDDENNKVAWTYTSASKMFVPLDYKEPVVELKRCSVCTETFLWDDDVLLHGNDAYHKKCVDVFPIAYGISIPGGDYVGESDNEDGEIAYSALEAGEYEEDEEEE